MQYTELMDSFAAKYGIDGFAVLDGVAAVEIDGTSVEFREDAEANAVIVSALFGEPPPDEKGRFASILLKANFLLAASGSAAFCLDAATEELAIVCSLPLPLADVDSLSSAVERIVDLAEQWRENAEAFVNVDDEAARVEANESAFNPLLGGNDFMRI